MTQMYFDYAATAPTDPLVIQAMEPYFFERFGNASSVHGHGRQAAKALEEARLTVAKFLGVQPPEIVFTSGGTESNNQAIFGTARRLKEKGNHIIISKIEHHSVLEPAEHLRKEGFHVTFLDVDQFGMVAPEILKKAITDKTILISIMHANNEIGTIQSIAELGAIAREHKVLFHVDAVQSVGHIPVNAQAMNADFLSLSGHKFYGPKGIGALYIRQGIQPGPFLVGGGQEKGWRASTQNVSGAVGLAKALELCQARMPQEIEALTRWRNRIVSEILKTVDGSRLNGHPSQRLPNNINFCFEGVNGESLLMALDMAGIAASMGAACTAGAIEPSHVLRAIGLTDEEALSSLRLTLGRWTQTEHIDYLLEKLPTVIKNLRI